MAREMTDLTDAEWQLVMIMREEAHVGLEIHIVGEPGQWRVRLTSHEIGRTCEGTGRDFSSAWDAAK